jgi:large subunit ribosomal protein L13
MMAEKIKQEILNLDFENVVLGRGSSLVAKELLKGVKVNIYNAEKAVITGNRNDIFAKYKEKQDFAGKGDPLKGPKYPKTPNGIVRRTIRGMVKRKKATGRDAYKNLKVFIGLTEGIKVKKLDKAQVNPLRKYITIAEVSKFLGSKW